MGLLSLAGAVLVNYIWIQIVLKDVQNSYTNKTQLHNTFNQSFYFSLI